MDRKVLEGKRPRELRRTMMVDEITNGWAYSEIGQQRIKKMPNGKPAFGKLD